MSVISRLLSSETKIAGQPQASKRMVARDAFVAIPDVRDAVSADANAQGKKVTVADWTSIINALAWPCVAVLALIYIWRSDAIAKLIQISEAVKDLKSKLAELIETEQRLSDRSASITEIVAVLKQASGDFAEIKAEVENIRDRVEEESEHTVSTSVGLSKAKSSVFSIAINSSAEDRFSDMELAWNKLLVSLTGVFGDFDKRSVAGEVYRYAHGNRKGTKLTYDTAEEIARLHSSIKSFRRRKATINNWLDEEISSKFISACAAAIEDVSKDTTDLPSAIGQN